MYIPISGADIAGDSRFCRNIPNSVGTLCHWMPVRSTNKVPASAARSGARGRPPFRFGRSCADSGSTTAQR